MSARRILFIITDLDVGGAEKCCVQLATGLDRSRWSPHVGCLSPAGVFAERLTAAGIPVHSLALTSPWQTSTAIWRTTRLIRQLRPVIVQTFLFHANVIGRIAARLAGVQRVLSAIRVAERRYRHHCVLENLTCRLARKIVCVSQDVARFTQRQSYVPRSRTVVIPNGIEVETEQGYVAARSSSGPTRAAVVVAYAGRLDRQKAVDVLLHAFAHACGTSSEIRLLIVGTGPDRDALESLTKRLGIERSVDFLGWQSDVPAILRQVDIFVLPSRWEGMPNVVLEAMAAGLPVIATRTEGTGELVRDGETGRLVPIDDPNALARAIIELVGDASKRQQWGRQGRGLAIREFSLSHMVRQYDQLYEALLC